MTLHKHHLHCVSNVVDLYSLDFQLATSLWFILKNISRTIQLAANPLLNPFDELSGSINPELLERISMPSPSILAIEKYTQNLLIVMSTRAELYHLFGLVQSIGLDGAQWIQTAMERCMESRDSLGWDWSKSGNSPAYSVTFPKEVSCRYIESSGSEEPDYSKALVLHPTLSTYAQENPDFNPFILPDDDTPN
jgi:hypothetical protein